MKRRFGILTLLLLAALLLTGAAQDEKTYSAERFDVDVMVEPGGSLLVTETVTFRFEGGPFTFVFRELPTDRTDGITNMTARVDGRLYPRGDQPGQVEIEGGDPIRVTWHLEPTIDASRTFVLTYRVLGVVRQENGADVLRWQALPDEYEYRIGRSRTIVGYPAATELVAAPEIQAGEAVISSEPGRVAFTATDLQPDEPLVVALRFPPGSLIGAPPEWQAARQAQAAQAPFWIAGAAAFLAAGLTAVLVRMRHFWRRSPYGKALVVEPPDELAPGLAGALLTADAKSTWANALGALFSLAERGVLEIDESPETKWYRKHEFLIRRLETPTDLLPHEAALLELLFRPGDGGDKTVKFSDLQRVVTSRRWKAFTETVQSQFKAADFISVRRQQARRTFIVAGFLLLAVGVALVILAAAWSAQVGMGPLAVAGAVIVLAIAILIGGAMISPLTDEAAERASEWKQFADYLRRVTRGKESVSGPQMFLKYLPYAAAFGLLPQWARHFEREGWTEPPPYFKALPTHDPAQNMAAFVAMSAATNTAGGSAAGAGAAGAGAAGGGASGAG